MKLITGDGRRMEVWDLGERVMTIRAGPAPIKFHGHRILTDDEARALVREHLSAGHQRE